MKKSKTLAGLLIFLLASTVSAAEIFESKDVKIITKLPPQYVGYSLYTGSLGGTTVHYRVSAVVSGTGETIYSPALTVYDCPDTLTSANSIKIRWAAVPGASSYNLYKSTVVAGTGDYWLLGNTTAKEIVDLGQGLGTKYSSAQRQGGSLVVENDVTIGDAVTIGGALSVAGAFTWDPGEPLTLAGPLAVGAIATRSTFTAAGDASIANDMDVVADLTAGTIASDANVTAATSLNGATLALSGAANIIGQTTLGAIATKSTITAAGAASFAGAVAAGSSLTAATSVNGATLALSGASNIIGEATFGAVTTKSTVTAAGNASFAGAVAAGSTLTAGTNIISTAGFIQLYSRSEAQIVALTPTAVGQAYYCNDCTTTAICISTGTGLGAFGIMSDITAVCD